MAGAPDAPGPDFALVAARYDELRPQTEGWWRVVDALVELGDLRGRRVLDVGCGTGRLASALAERHAARVWGVDPEPAMLEVARARVPRGAGLKVGRAEELPFRDGWFERATMTLVVHLVDRPRAFAELRRVLAPGGRVALATFDPASFERYYLNDFFPSIRELDRARFPHPDVLADELAAAGFGPVDTRRVSERVSLTRETALEKIRGRHISTFQLIPDDEYRGGLARAERELPATIGYDHELVVLAAGRDK